VLYKYDYYTISSKFVSKINGMYKRKDSFKMNITEEIIENYKT